MQWIKKLQNHWKLKNAQQVILVLLTFACTGSTVAYISKAGVKWLGIGGPNSIAYSICFRLFMFIFGYQILILFFGFIFGQFQFFWNYEKKILRWMALKLGIKK
jgi:hypothetical protein